MIEKNKVASFHYVLKLEDGTVADTSLDSEPLLYLHGHHNLIPGLESQLEGMKIGDKKSIVVSPSEGYGDYDDNCIVRIDKKEFSNNPISVGMQFQAEVESVPGPRVYTITEITDSFVTADGNHPLAGKILKFQVEITDVREATSEELSHGHAHPKGTHSH